jgi:uncharacterized repeat protein (TIGR01451 family)
MGNERPACESEWIDPYAGRPSSTKEENMSARNRSRRGGREIARAPRRAGLLAILSSVVLLVGQFMALADKPDKADKSDNGVAASANGQAHASEGEDESSDDGEDSDDGDNGDVEAEAEVDAEGNSGNGSSNRVHGDDHTSKITICHRTGSIKNPYVQITVAREAAGDPGGEHQGGQDHFGIHTGPVFDSSMEQGDSWGDIIPDVDDDGNPMPHDGLNWDADGQAIWEAGCEFVSNPGPGQQTLALVKTGTATITQGGTVTYTVTVTNSGTAAAESVVISDDVDDSFTGVTATSTVGTCSVGGNNRVTCNVGTLAGGTSATITITATAPTGTCPTITNQATGTFSGGTIPVSGTVTTTVTGCPGGGGGGPEISVRIQKTNDANEDGIFTNNEESKNEGRDVDFKLVITNTSDETVMITDLTDTFGQTELDLLDAECPSLDGLELDPGESVTCTFTLANYSPPEDTAIVNVAEVCVQIVGGVLVACDDNPSRVRSAVVLGRTVTPSTPPPTRTPPGGVAFTGPAAVVPLAALALVLLTVGTGFLWAGRRRGRVNG